MSKISQGADGVYRWVREVSMYRDPATFFSVCKIMGLFVGAAYVFVLLTGISEGADAVLGITKAFAVIVLVLFALSVISYLVIARVYGGKYVVMYEMDGKKIRVIRIPTQYSIEQVQLLIGYISDLSPDDPAAADAGLIASSKNSSTTVFESVKKIRADRKHDLIITGRIFDRNRIYVDAGDYDTVFDFIRDHCPLAKVG